MAVKIPQYTPQVGTPGNLIRGADMSVPGFYKPDLSGFDQLARTIRVDRQEMERKNALAEFAADEPDVQLTLQQEYDNLTSGWTPGGKDIPEAMGSAIDRVMDGVAARTTHPDAQRLLLDRRNQLKTEYMLRGFHFQREASVTYRKHQYTSGYEKAAQVGALDPVKFGAEIAKLNAAVMADADIPEIEKERFARSHAVAAAQTVALSVASLQPERAQAITNSLLGVTEPTFAPSATGERFEDSIARLESGGRMFDGRGRVLRGPAITAADGTTYHAYGKYQLTEATAKATAEAAGVPWNPNLFHGKTGDKDATAEYHELLGTSHIAANAARFGNDPVVVAAAHNMGAGAAAAWAAGRPYQTQSGKWWYPSKPKDLAAMPAETRAYVDKLGPIEERAPAKVDDEEVTAFRLLDVPDLLQVRAHAASILAARERERQSEREIGGAMFRQRLENIEQAALRGETFEMPTNEEFVTYLPAGQAILTRTKLQHYQRMGGTLGSLPGLSNEELLNYASMPDPEGTDDRANRQFVRDTIAERAQKLLAARNADPGQAVLDSVPQVQTLFGDWQRAASAFYGAGPNATDEQFTAMAGAQSAFVTGLFAQQRAWGVTQPRLPKSILGAIAEGFKAQMERDPVAAAIYISRLPAMLGSDEAVDEVGQKLGALGQLAMDGVPGMVLAKINAMRKIHEGDRSKLLPAGETMKEIREHVRRAFDPLLDSLAAQHDAVTADRYIDAGVMLTISKISEGGGLKDSERAAYAELFGDRNTVVGAAPRGMLAPLDKLSNQAYGPELRSIYRIDSTKYNARHIEMALSAIRAEIDPLVEPEPGFTLEESRARKKRMVRMETRWVNNAAGTGVYLVGKTGPVLDTDGRPVEVLFEDAAKFKVPSVRTPSPDQFKGTRGIMY